MAQHDTFRWHKDATLFVGDTAVPRPTPQNPQGFRTVDAHDVGLALAALGAAVQNGDPFCIGVLPAGHVPAQAAEFLTLTGGTTGAPKAICRSQASWIASFRVNQQVFGLMPGQATATLGHLGHSLTLYAVLEALHLGLSAHVLGALTPTAQRANLARHGTQTLYATPTQLRLLTQGRAVPSLPLIRQILCGGGALDPITMLATQALCPNAQIRQFYGAAETSFVTLTDAQTPQGSVGKPYPNVELRLKQDEVWVRSPYLFKGYATGQPAPHDPDGFVSVGELGTLDAQGNLWLTGRKNRQVQIADQSTSPDQVEHHIMAHCGPHTCAVLPVPDATRGARLVAVVHGDPNVQIANQITQSSRAAFGPLVAPRLVVFQPDWPLLPSGKTDLAALARWLETQT